METTELLKKRRSIRKFKQEIIKKEDLVSLVEAASFAHSVCNRQVLRYFIVTDREKVKLIFENSSLGMISRGEEGLTTSEYAPTAYIAITTLGSASHLDFADAGAAFQNMALQGIELNLGLNWLHAFADELLHSILTIPNDHSTISLIAIGKPNESPNAISIDPNEKQKYNFPGDKNNKIPVLRTKYLIHWCS